MKLSPRSAREARTIRTTVKSMFENPIQELQPDRVYLLGFDWRVAASVARGQEDGLRLLQHNKCYRAVAYVGATDGDFTKITILDIGGDQAYALNYHPSDKTVFWCKPDDLAIGLLKSVGRR